MGKLNLYKWQQEMLDNLEKESRKPLVYIGGVPKRPVSAMYYALTQAMIEYGKKHEKVSNKEK